MTESICMRRVGVMYPHTTHLFMSPGPRHHPKRPYDLTWNPIELAFRWVKKFLKRHENRAITNPLQTIDEALRSVTRADAVSYFVKCG